MTMRLRLMGTFVLVVGIFVFAGSALAGNGHGNGNGNGSDGAPGSSGSAPGQVKKDAPPAAAGTTTAPTTAPVGPPAHEHSTQPKTDPAGGGRSGDAVARTASQSKAAGSQGVLAGTRRASELPFTGERLWIAFLAGLLLLGSGLVLRQI